MDRIRIGTRGSRLATTQTNMVAELLKTAHPNLDVEIEIITTSGDWKPEHGEKPLSESDGGKGLFIKEIEQALIDGRIDCAVHSLKDVPTFLPKGMNVDHMLKRTCPCDCLIARDTHIRSIADLPQGAIVGTSSVRRKAILLYLRPDLDVRPIRGNVPTRIEKMDKGDYDAIILAVAGMDRLGLDSRINVVLSPEHMLPAVGQGIIAIESAIDNKDLRAVLDTINDNDAHLCAVAERAMLAVLDGSCHTPIGSYAYRDPATGEMSLRGLVAALDGSEIFREELRDMVGCATRAKALGQKIGEILKDRVPPALLEHAA